MSLFAYLRRTSPRSFAWAILASIISGCTGASFIVVVNASLHRETDERSALAWVYISLCLASIGTRIISQVLLYRLAQGLIFDLRRRLIDRLLGAPLRVVEKTGTPKVFATLSEDVVVIGNALPGLPLVCSSAAFAVVALVYLTSVSLIVAGATALAVVAGVLSYRLFGRFGMRHLGLAREDQDILFEHFRAITDGLKELKLNRRRREVVAGDELDTVANSFRRRSITGLTIFEGAAGSGQAIIFALIAVVLFSLPLHFEISAATLSSAVLTLLFVVNSLQAVLVWLPAIGRASVALGKIEEQLEALAPEGSTDPEGRDAAPVDFGNWNSIEFRAVSYLYPGPTGEQFLLGPLDFEFRRGEVLFVVGGNGSGKTTFAKLLTGLYIPEGGAVWVDGVEVTSQNRDSYRQIFSAVFSDFFVFDGLVGLPAQDLAAKADAYLSRLQLDHKVGIVGEKFSTTALSQGQRKRLALLTAYLEDRSFYLFDEWAADQDPVFKGVFYEELLGELKATGKAVVVISHDDRYFDLADRLVTLDYGQMRQREIVGG